MMTDLQKEALLRELCYRFIYGVKVEFREDDKKSKLVSKIGKVIKLPVINPPFIDNTIKVLCDEHIYTIGLDSIRIILRPLDSFTDKEIEEYGETFEITKMNYPTLTGKSFDWLMKNMVDFYGAIELGIAVCEDQIEREF